MHGSRGEEICEAIQSWIWGVAKQCLNHVLTFGSGEIRQWWQKGLHCHLERREAKGWTCFALEL